MVFQLFAQLGPGPFNNQDANALINLRDSINLAEATYQSWQQVWEAALDPQSGLWYALVSLGLLLTAFSIIYLVFTQGKEIVDRHSWSELVSMFVWPLVILVFLGGNGGLLSGSVQLIKAVGQAQVQKVMQIQLGEVTFQTAMSTTGISTIAKTRIEGILNECKNLPPGKLQQCWTEKQPVLEQVLVEAERENGGPLQALRRWVNGVTQYVNQNTDSQGNLDLGPALSGVFSSPFLFMAREILYALQWAFVNMLEAAMLLTALFSPIAMGLSLLPLQGRPIIAWLISFFALIGMQLGYNIVVGLCSTVMTYAETIAVSDLAFLIFLSIFAPILAVSVAGGGGVALFHTLSNNIKGISDLVSNALGTATSIAVSKIQKG